MMRSRLAGLPSLDSSFQLVGGQHAVKSWSVCFLDGMAGHVEGFAQVHGRACDGGPSGIFWDEELVLVPIR